MGIDGSAISAKALSDICTNVDYGYTASASAERVGPRFLRITDIQGGRFDWLKVPFCEANEKEFQKYRLALGDIVIARTGNSTGENAQVWNEPPEAVFASYLIRFRVDAAQANPFFVGYQLRSDRFREHVSAVRSGSAQPGANARQLGNFVVHLPPLHAQETAVAVLRSLDDRIALLRETNATLEAIAQSLFKSWFVDFDAVRTKQQGLAPAGVDEATAALLPDGFDDSAIGSIPAGWKVAALDKIATFLNGLALQKFPPSDDGWLPVIKIAQLRKGDTVGADRAGTNIKSDYVVKNGDVLFSWSGSLEVEVWCGGVGALNQHLFKVTSKEYPKWFYYLWTLYHLETFRQIAASKATTMGHIQRVHLTEATVLVPPAAVIAALDPLFASLLDRKIENELQARTLASLRDTLLPRLTSGQLRLHQAEATQAES